MVFSAHKNTTTDNEAFIVHKNTKGKIDSLSLLPLFCHGFRNIKRYSLLTMMHHKKLHISSL